MAISQLSRRGLLADTLDQSGVGRLLRGFPSWQGVLILNYHRIGDPKNSFLDRELWSATEHDFDQQVALVSQNFPIIGLDDLPTALNSRRQSVMITFDDGYRDNYETALPILKRHGVPGVFFVTTGFLDQAVVPWWDEIAWMVHTSREPSIAIAPWAPSPMILDRPSREDNIRTLLGIYKKLEGSQTATYINHMAEVCKTGRAPASIAENLWMTWDMLREIRAAGMSVGGHTVNHQILSNLSASEQDYEIGECKRRLVNELGEPIDAFSFPVGGPESFNADTRAALRRHRFEWAFTYFGGYCRPGHNDPYALSRTAIELDITPTMFRAIATLPQWFA